MVAPFTECLRQVPPNNRYALQTMTEELRLTKMKLGKPLTRMDLGALVIPLGTTHGTTNAVVFGIGLMAQRDSQLNVVDAIPESFTHHDIGCAALVALSIGAAICTSMALPSEGIEG